MNLKIGFGYDIHKLKVGRKLILCGVQIPFEKGLYGHSDADLMLHAIADALLGASGLPDIGELFPDTEETFRNISSLKILKDVGQKVFASGSQIINIDVTLLAQAPKISIYKEQMCSNICAALKINSNQINIKAKTKEGVDATGGMKAMEAYAVCLLSSKS